MDRSSIMDTFLKIPQALATRCIQHAEFTQLAKNTIGYDVDIAAITKLRQGYCLERPDYLKHASQQRLDEFYAGRIVAEAILAQHFNCAVAITSMSASLPIWPLGILGSISHAQHKLIIVISTQAAYLGVDVEYIVSPEIAEKTARLVLTQSEYDLYATGNISDLSFSEYFTLVFSLKESLYKAVYPITQHYIDFLQAELLHIDVKQQTAVLKFSPEIVQSYPVLKRYHATWERASDHVITLLLN